MNYGHLGNLTALLQADKTLAVTVPQLSTANLVSAACRCVLWNTWIFSRNIKYIGRFLLDTAHGEEPSLFKSTV
jgi:hypothetical protein